jgi:hypothetical protein
LPVSARTAHPGRLPFREDVFPAADKQLEAARQPLCNLAPTQRSEPLRCGAAPLLLCLEFGWLSLWAFSEYLVRLEVVEVADIGDVPPAGAAGPSRSLRVIGADAAASLAVTLWFLAGAHRSPPGRGRQLAAWPTLETISGISSSTTALVRSHSRASAAGPGRRRSSCRRSKIHSRTRPGS